MTKFTVSKTNSYTGHRDCVYALAGTSGRHFYSSGGDGMVVEWDLEEPDKGDLIAQVPSSVYALEVIEESNTLLVGQNFEGLQWIDLTERKIKNSLKIEDAAIFDIEVIGDHLILALGSGKVLILKSPQLEPVKWLDYSNQSARTIALSVERQVFAVGYSDNAIRVFDLETFSLLKEIQAHDNSVFALDYSPDGQFLLSGSRDAHLKVWDTGNYQLHESVVAHMYALNDVVFSPNGKHFVTCSMDKSIKVWDYSTLKLLKVIDKSRHAGHGTSVNKLFWSSFNEKLLSCSDDRAISQWDLQFS